MPNTPLTADHPLTHGETRAALAGIEGALHGVQDAIVLLNETLPALAPRNEVDAKVSLVLAEAKAMDARFARDRRLSRFIGVGLGIIILVLSIVVFSLRDTQEANTQVIDAINGCTQPEGQCFKDNRVSLEILIERVTDDVADENQRQLCEILDTYSEDLGGLPDTCTALLGGG